MRRVSDGLATNRSERRGSERGAGKLFREPALRKPRGDGAACLPTGDDSGNTIGSRIMVGAADNAQVGELGAFTERAAWTGLGGGTGPSHSITRPLTQPANTRANKASGAPLMPEPVGAFNAAPTQQWPVAVAEQCPLHGRDGGHAAFCPTRPRFPSGLRYRP